MVREQGSTGRGGRGLVSRLTLRWMMRLTLAGSLAAPLACVSWVGPSHEQARLAELLAQSPSQELGDQPSSSLDGFYLHVAGLVECSGFLTKTQTAFGEVWATKPGKDGERMKMSELELRIIHSGGLFDGLDKKKVIHGAEILRHSDVVRGNFSTDLCGCVWLVGRARVPITKKKIRTRLRVCSET